VIGLILGTSEGRNILSLLNKYTDDIFVSTASAYGGELLKDYRYKIINTRPLSVQEMVSTFKENSIKILVDATHPYAVEATKNIMEACSSISISYVRYERPPVLSSFKSEKIIEIENYEELYEKLKNIKGTILNTTGSNNIENIKNLRLPNRVVHRVLPTVESITKCLSLGIKVEDIVAIKGPVSYELNCSFIREYDTEAIILKDSGVQGGTEEKLRACMDLGIYAFVLKRKTILYDKIFYNENEIVDYIVKSLGLV
jgi:precorrin-6A/cobalt-precorrin-6A reductase